MPPQIERVEAFREPAIDRSEQFASLLPLPLIAPEPREAHRRAQFQGLRLLFTRDGECTLKILFSFRRIRLGRLKRDFAGNAMEIGLPPAFFGSLHGRHHFANETPCIIELAELNIGLRQIRYEQVKNKVAPDERNAAIPGLNLSIASEDLPVMPTRTPRNIIPIAFQSKAPFSSATKTEFLCFRSSDRVISHKGCGECQSR